MKKIKNLFVETAEWFLSAAFIIFIIIACLFGVSIITGVLCAIFEI